MTDQAISPSEMGEGTAAAAPSRMRQFTTAGFMTFSLALGIGGAAHAEEAQPASPPAPASAPGFAEGALGDGMSASAVDEKPTAAPAESFDTNTITRHGMDALRTVTPWVVLAGAAELGYMLAFAKSRQERQLLLQLATRERLPSGYGRWKNFKERHPFLRQDRLPRSLMVGTLAPVLGITAIGAMAGMEEEVRTGPNRAQAAFASAFPAEDFDELYLVQQDGTRHTSNHSVLSSDVARAFTEAAEARNVAATPITINLGSGSVGDVFLEGVPGVVPEVESGLPGVIADANEGFQVGDQLQLRGAEVEVAALSEEPASYLNRLVFQMNEDDLTDILGMPDDSHSGFLVDAHSEQEVEALLQSAGILEETELLSIKEWFQENEKFWRVNGSPILTMATFMFAIAEAYMFARARGQEFEAQKKSLGLLRSVGGGANQLKRVGVLRDDLKLLAAAPIGYVVLSQVLTSVNQANVGFHTDTTNPKNMLYATGTIFAAQRFAVWRNNRRIARLSPTEIFRSAE